MSVGEGAEACVQVGERGDPAVHLPCTSSVPHLCCHVQEVTARPLACSPPGLFVWGLRSPIHTESLCVVAIEAPVSCSCTWRPGFQHRWSRGPSFPSERSWCPHRSSDRTFERLFWVLCSARRSA